MLWVGVLEGGLDYGLVERRGRDHNNGIVHFEEGAIGKTTMTKNPKERKKV